MQSEGTVSSHDYAKAMDDLLSALRKDRGSFKTADDEPIHDWEFFTPEEKVYTTKILSPGDPVGDSDQFRQANQLQVESLEDRETWVVVYMRELPTDANIIGGRFVLTIKECGTHNATPKARYVGQGHKNREKEFLVHSTTNLRQRSIRVIVSFAAVRGYRIFSHDVKQAYLQSDEKLTRKIYVAPKKKDLQFSRISAEQVLDLQKLLYGNGDAGDYWGVTYDNHVRSDLHMTPTSGDPSLYLIIPQCNKNEDEPEGCMGVYVDDSLLAGNMKF